MKRNKQSAIGEAASRLMEVFKPGTFRIAPDDRAKCAPMFNGKAEKAIHSLPQSAKAVFARICDYVKKANEGLFVSLMECFNLQKVDAKAFSTLKDSLVSFEKASTGTQRTNLNILNRAVELLDGYSDQVERVLALPDAPDKLSHLGVVASIINGSKDEEKSKKAKEAFGALVGGASVKKLGELRPAKVRRQRAARGSTSKTGEGQSAEKRPVLYGFIIGAAVTPARVYDGTVKEIDNDLQVSGLLKDGIAYFNGTVYRRGESPVTAHGETVIVSDTGRLAARTDPAKAQANADEKARIAKEEKARAKEAKRIEALKAKTAKRNANAVPAGLK